MLKGVLELDGMRLPGRRVLLISGDTTRLLSSAVTAHDGSFEFQQPVDQSQTKVILLAKIQGPVIGVYARLIDVAQEGTGPHKVAVDSSSNEFHTVGAQITSGEGWPPYLLLHIDPVHLEGVPEPLEKFFNAVDEQVIESWFYQQRIDGDHFEIRVQEGSYRIEVHYFNKSRAELITPGIQNYGMVQVTADGESSIDLDDPFSSFMLKVDRDRSLNVVVGPISELP